MQSDGAEPPAAQAAGAVWLLLAEVCPSVPGGELSPGPFTKGTPGRQQ